MYFFPNLHYAMNPVGDGVGVVLAGDFFTTIQSGRQSGAEGEEEGVTIDYPEPGPPIWYDVVTAVFMYGMWKTARGWREASR